MPTMQAWRCRACGAKYHTLEHNGTRTNVDSELDACVCGSGERDGIVESAAPVRLDSKHGYPRMHPQLGWVESLAHEDRLLKAMGATRAIDGGADDMIAQAERDFIEIRKMDEFAEREMQRLEEDSGFADARRLRDKDPTVDWRWGA